jgi:hypothetical protein
LHGLCLSLEGRGRFEWGQQKHLFRFESLKNTSKKTWTLALHIPVHGEELFELSYHDILSGVSKVKGDFYNRLKEDKTLGVHADRFVTGLGLLLALSEDSNVLKCNGDNRLQCRFNTKGFEIDMLKVEHGLTDIELVLSTFKMRVKITENASTKGSKGHYPNRLDFILTPLDQQREAPALTLALFPTQCLQ